MFSWRKNFGWGTLDSGIFVMVHDKTAPAGENWDACMADLASFAEGHNPMAIVFTDGGAPTGPQRAALNRLVGKSPPTAVVSDAVITRFVVSSLALMNASIATFSSKEIGQAWLHLGLSGNVAKNVASELAQQKRHLAPFQTLRRALNIPDAAV